MSTYEAELLSGRAKVLLEAVAPFAAAGILFGLLYNTLFYPRTPVEYAEAGSIGLLLGLSAGFAEQTVLRRWLQQRSFIQAIAARTLLYSVVVALTLAVVLSIEPAALGECTYLSCVREQLQGPLFLRDLGFSIVFVFLATFTAQVVLLVGTRNFGRLIVGRYRKPRELHAAFMFVDIRGSTTIAEEMGHERYSAFLRDFFTHVSGAIHRAKGEVYQYIGDEVVVVWPGRRASAHWLSCFLSMREAIEVERSAYEQEFGTVPEFKAGVHAGEVIITEVGTLQRAHVYHGDVLNTAARIQAKCNETGFDLLVSEAALRSVASELEEQFEQVGALPLRGKSEPITMYGLHGSRNHRGSV